MCPKISILIPVYNTETYLRSCLDTAIHQTMPEIEILCADDGSTDHSPDILKEYQQQDSRVKVFFREHFGGGATRNFLLSQAQGEYVYFLDSDDFIALDLCEKTYRKAQETGADIVSFFWHNVSCPEWEPSLEGLSHKDKIHSLDKIQTLFYNCNTPWSVLWKRSFLRINQLQFPTHLVSHDVPFSVEAALAANKIVILPERLYYYHRREKSIQNTPTNVPGILDTNLYTLQIMKKKGVTYECYQWVVRTLFERYYDLLHNHQDFLEIVRRKLAQNVPREVWDTLWNTEIFRNDVLDFYFFIPNNGVSWRKKFLQKVRLILRNNRYNQRFKKWCKKIKLSLRKEKAIS